MGQAVVYEGLHTYGGMAGRGLEALASGIEESVQDDHIRARIGQVGSLSNAFTSAFKKLDPIPQFKATAKLGEFLDQLTA